MDVTLFAYRLKTHKTTGYSPFYLIYGRQAILPVELKIPSGRIETDNVEDVLMERLPNNRDARERPAEVLSRVQKEQQKQKSRHDQKGLSEKLKIGDKVLVEQT